MDAFPDWIHAQSEEDILFFHPVTAWSEGQPLTPYLELARQLGFQKIAIDVAELRDDGGFSGWIVSVVKYPATALDISTALLRDLTPAEWSMRIIFFNPSEFQWGKLHLGRLDTVINDFFWCEVIQTKQEAVDWLRS